MATKKISVTLDEGSVARAQSIAGPRGLSSYLDAALEEKLARDELRRRFLDHLADVEAVDPTPPDERARGVARADRIRRAVG